ncbi:HlyD family efflux transporter periplasmic adaptor subunit [Halocynthiibacter styelae]|uniref:HlyD family efflux transporter periplasmic adaptor subunit n=1 Tax=Halocynthiibacter styelae TaxID=2761955 RepID=A0A8J7LPS5_9RHOB|nr:HlyD family efflux transporter periplasmic adaptor subunit [Paenihalocynthiibacter styelae]MBI1493217.1 HlyD family efflux transporter periplasmic adaptor subunit [Paenihalocynthiibacter styelae]
MTTSPKSDLTLELEKPDPVSRPRIRFRKRYFLVLLIPVLMFTGAVMGMYFQPAGLQKFYAATGLQPGGGATSPIALPPEIDLPQEMVETLLPEDVVGLARVLPRGDVSLVSAPFGAGDARISEIFVAAGDQVTRGTILARLDNYDALQSAILLAEANLSVRVATLTQTRMAVQASSDEAQATLDQALAAADQARSEETRIATLLDRNVATQATLDAAHSARVQADQAVTRAAATLARFTSIDLNSQPDVIVASRNVDAAQADLMRVENDISRAQVLAPIDGTILDIHVTAGERPPASGLIEMGDIRQMMAEVEIYQDRVGEVQIGQPVQLISSALPRALRGKVETIGRMVGRQGLISSDAAANTDARVVQITVALDEASSEMASYFVNLEAVARIDTRPQPEAQK